MQRVENHLSEIYFEGIFPSGSCKLSHQQQVHFSAEFHHF